MNLIYVTFSNGAERGFLTGKAAMRYAERRGLSVVSVGEKREVTIADAFTPPDPFSRKV